MKKDLVKTPSDALLYMAECQLATVADMASKKSKSINEFKRQIAISQLVIDWIKLFKIDIEVDSRIYKVLSTEEQKVEVWLQKFIQ